MIISGLPRDTEMPRGPISQPLLWILFTIFLKADELTRETPAFKRALELLTEYAEDIKPQAEVPEEQKQAADELGRRLEAVVEDVFALRELSLSSDWVKSRHD